MAYLDGPYRHDVALGYSCGAHRSDSEHDALAAARRQVARTDPAILAHLVWHAAALKALFPHDAVRRRFLRAVGATTAAAAVAQFLPLATLNAMAQDKGALEKKNLKIGFIPITCSTPLIMADPLNFFKNEGLEVSLVKTAGWALIRGKVLNKEHDASHMLAPMPLAISTGVGSVAEMNVAAIQNINGQAITLALKHKDKHDPSLWKGMTFAVPFDYAQLSVALLRRGARARSGQRRPDPSFMAPDRHRLVAFARIPIFPHTAPDERRLSLTARRVQVEPRDRRTRQQSHDATKTEPAVTR